MTNHEAFLTAALPAEGAAFAPQVTWAVGMKTGAAALLPRNSGQISHNPHRLRPYNRDLNQVFYTSDLISIQHTPELRAF